MNLFIKGYNFGVNVVADKLACPYFENNGCQLFKEPSCIIDVSNCVFFERMFVRYVHKLFEERNGVVDWVDDYHYRDKNGKHILTVKIV